VVPDVVPDVVPEGFPAWCPTWCPHCNTLVGIALVAGIEVGAVQNLPRRGLVVGLADAAVARLSHSRTTTVLARRRGGASPGIAGHREQGKAHRGDKGDRSPRPARTCMGIRHTRPP
jgi:hypothetical protein